MLWFLFRDFRRPSGERPTVVWWLFVVAVAGVLLVWLPGTLGLAEMLDLSVVFVLALLALSMSFSLGLQRHAQLRADGLFRAGAGMSMP